MLKLTTILFVIAFFVLALLHYLALTLHLYWHFSWLDMPMHFFGGIVVALGVFTTADLIKRFPERLLLFVPVISFVLIVALSWEVFELYAGAEKEASHVLDTISDLVLGIIGGSCGWYLARQLRANFNTNG